MTPPMVPMLRTWLSPTSPATSASSGSLPFTTLELWMVTCRVSAPMRSLFPSSLMWSSSLMPLMSTKAVGCARRSRISGMRLCPPARTFASSPYLFSSLEASSTRRRGRIRKRPVSLACLLHLLPETVGACRHVDVFAAKRCQRIADRIDDGCARRDRARLADSLHSELVGRAWRDRVVGRQGGDLVCGGHRVVEQGARLQLPGIFVVDDFFEKRLGDALRDATMNLPLDDRRVDDVSAVVDRYILLNLNRARLRIHLDHADVGAERPDAAGRVEIGNRFQALLHALRQARAVRGKCHLTERLGLVGAPLDMELALVENDVFFRRFQYVRGQLPGLVDHLAAGAADRDTAHREASTACGSVAHGGAFAGVAMAEVDAFHRHPERVGHNLGERGFVALAVRVGPGVHDHRARRHHADLGGLRQRDATGGRGGGGAGTEAAELDPGREPDAHVLALLPTLDLLLAQLVVARQFERSVEALFVITAVDDQPEVLREREVLRLNEVLAPDRDRVHADLARDQVNHPLDKMGRLRAAGSAVGVGRHLVGEHPDGA